MSKIGKIGKMLQPVIIKGFMGEPEVLSSINKDISFVTVVGRSKKTQMRLKVKYVYHYDEELYQKLKNAFNSKDSERLETEWQKAKPIMST